MDRWKLVRLGFCLAMLAGLLLAGCWGRWVLRNHVRRVPEAVVGGDLAVDDRSNIFQFPKQATPEFHSWLWQPPEVPLSPHDRPAVDPIARIGWAYNGNYPVVRSPPSTWGDSWFVTIDVGGAGQP